MLREGAKFVWIDLSSTNVPNKKQQNPNGLDTIPEFLDSDERWHTSLQVSTLSSYILIEFSTPKQQYCATMTAMLWI